MAQTTQPRRRPPAAQTTAEPEVVPGPARPRRRGLAIAAGVLVVLAAILQLRLAAQERSGPPHGEFSIGDGIPATLYLPGESDDGGLPVQKPVGERPPVVVVAHGYSADQQIMSALARSLARAGYAALTFDFRGHGSNTSAFRGDLRDDLTAVVDWAETSPLVDGERVAVLGHSMGASAALDFAGLDDRVDAVIPVSGGWGVTDARTPPHVLFLVAENDPQRIHDRQGEVAEILTGDAEVESFEVGGTDHVTILWSSSAIEHVVSFLDPIFGVERPAGADVGLRDARLGTAGLYFLVALALIALVGLAAGSVVPPMVSGATGGAFALLAGALIVTMPLLAAGGFSILPIGAGQAVAMHLALAAAVLWTTRLFVRRGVVTGAVAGWVGDGPWLPLRSVLWPGIAAGVAIFVLLSPFAGLFHRLMPTPSRLVLWIVVAALGLPFFAAFEAIVRRGSALAAIGWGVLGRALLLVLLFAGVAVGVLPGVIGLVAPLLVGQYVLLEIFAATAYARGRNPALVAVVDSIFIAWMAVTLTPIS